ncbi:AEC family transporter (plasmid) [Skermanella mucosa]|uniref:AEC family transporter n=1 Tax=Skermanella mucosa TaxID=1789672 RepID=UPI00192CC9CE|nr:AEC family transporter [Skermanella mucosa]UEM25050.1 AEC family transporter [Skermanella mucosa]
MMIFINIILPVFGLILVGYVAGRTSILPPAAVRGVANAATWLMIPVLLFRSTAGEGTARNMEPAIALAYFGGCLVILALAFACGRTLFRLRLDQLGVFGMAAMYSNAVLLGLPLIQTAFGPEGVVLQTKIIAFHSLILLPVTTVLIALGRGHSGGLTKLVLPAVRETLSNPIIIGLLSGLAWSFTGLGIWEPLDRMTAMLAAAAAPTALIALGAAQAQSALRIGGELVEALTVAVLKLVLHPLVVWLLAAKVAGLSPEAVAVATVTAALPAGANVYLQAHQFGCYVAGAVNAVMLTTLLSVVSITVVLALLHPA